MVLLIDSEIRSDMVDVPILLMTALTPGLPAATFAAQGSNSDEDCAENSRSNQDLAEGMMPALIQRGAALSRRSGVPLRLWHR
jgi:hypothetical protein